ncbi:Tfp pilus assembly protein FimT/FimU [Archangium sp.]|uniref:pilus assembly FimT family protein n=1 Tax=Archangium sp. TaxID=1872627 RepID=UPI00389AF0F2
MNNHVNPAKHARRARGFTLLEVMIVVAILGVLTALSVVTYDAVGNRGALQNAAFDLQSTMSVARTRAMSRGYPVWVVFFSSANRKGQTGGDGAFMVVEDRSSRFVRNPVTLYSLELKPTATSSRDELTGQVVESGEVSSVYFLDDYNKKVRFGALKPGRVGLFGAPFTALAVQTCSFCSAAGSLQGAIAFSPDGGARFYDGGGNPVSGTNHSLALSSVDGLKQQIFAISGPSGYIAAFSPDKP